MCIMIRSRLLAARLRPSYSGWVAAAVATSYYASYYRSYYSNRVYHAYAGVYTYFSM